MIYIISVSKSNFLYSIAASGFSCDYWTEKQNMQIQSKFLPNMAFLIYYYVRTMPCIFWKQALKERLSNNTTFSMPCTINDKNNLNSRRKGFCLWLKVHLILSFLLSSTFTSPLVPLQNKKYRSDLGTRLCFKFWIQISLITSIRR